MPISPVRDIVKQLFMELKKPGMSLQQENAVGSGQLRRHEDQLRKHEARIAKLETAPA
jgi:hypothetical protein